MIINKDFLYVDGWIPCDEKTTFSYNAYDSSVKELILNTSKDTNYFLTTGARIKIIQGSNICYGIITSVESSIIRIFVAEGNSVSRTGVFNNIYYSLQKAPLGFPLDKNKWVIQMEGYRDVTASAGVEFTFCFDFLKIIVPKGAWNVSYGALISSRGQGGTYGNMKTILSSMANSSGWIHETIDAATVPYDMGYYFQGSGYYNAAMTSNVLLLVAHAWYGGNTDVKVQGGANNEYSPYNKPYFIRAVCAYL